MTLERIEFAPREVLDFARALFAKATAAKGIALQCTVDRAVPRRLVGDPGRLRQIVLNLIGNAVKFTGAGRIEVHATVAPSNGADSMQLRFQVKDTGIGIATGEQACIFEPFTQVDSSTTRKFGGTGLGLTVSRQLVELMGGAIGVESTPGAGSTFWFTAVFGNAGAAQATIATAQAAPPNRIDAHVLLVEDNSINRKVALAMLTALEYKVTVAVNGCEAVARFGEQFDLVLMDCHMPEIDGFEATTRIRVLKPRTAARECRSSR